jgi:hypothetical protein
MGKLGHSEYLPWPCFTPGTVRCKGEWDVTIPRNLSLGQRLKDKGTASCRMRKSTPRKGAARWSELVFKKSRLSKSHIFI